jgi:uncharacterized protein (TIGR03000 family)
MYSVVLMLALTNGSEMPDCGRHRGGCCCYCVYQPVCIVNAAPVAVPPAEPEQPPPSTPTVYPETEEDKAMLKELMTLIPDPADQKKVKDYWTAPGVDSEARKEFYDTQKKQLKEETSRRDTPVPAKIIVSLPEDARLFIDDEATSSTSKQRVFVSPPLPAGQLFHYTLRAEVVRDGKVVSFTQKVAIRAGKLSEVQLTEPSHDRVVSR